MTTNLVCYYFTICFDFSQIGWLGQKVEITKKKKSLINCCAISQKVIDKLTFSFSFFNFKLNDTLQIHLTSHSITI